MTHGPSPGTIEGAHAVGADPDWVEVTDGLPVGLQVMAPHFQEQLLLDLALIAEVEGKTVPGSRPGASTPAATNASPSPALIACAAIRIVCSEEEQ